MSIIRVNQLSKRYRIGAAVTRGHTFREALTHTATAPLRWMRQGRAGGRYEELWALKDVNFEVEQGEVVGIIGRNGAGKSTLLKVLSRITEPTEGQVEIEGRVGSLLEVGTGFHPELTGRENIFLNGAILGMKKTEIVRKFDEIVAFSEIDKFLDTPVKRYSSGMYMRLAFAVAAHLDPEVLIVDEVLAVGDAQFQKKCLGKMDEVAKAGRTILFVSHNMAAMQALCTRCLLLEQGRVVDSGLPGQVVASYLNQSAAVARVDLSKRTTRQGNGQARIVMARTLDPDGNESPTVPMGQGVGIELTFELRGDPLSFPSFGVLLRSATGQPITRVLTRETVGQIPPATRNGRVLLHINRLELMPGSYYLTLSMSNGRDQLDYVEDALILEVIPEPVFPGGRLPPADRGFLIYLPCNWEFDYEPMVGEPGQAQL